MESLQSHLETGGELDREAFVRVWRRVMPEDRPDCPFTLEPFPTPFSMNTPSTPSPPSAIYLGEESAAELPRLNALLEQETDHARICQTIFRRFRMPGLAALAEEKRRQVKRLNAARFLISGETYPVPPTTYPRFPSLALALRDRFQAEQRLNGQLQSAAELTSDLYLAGLYRELAEESSGHARRIWQMVEKL